MQGNDGKGLFWGVIASSAVALGLVVALLAGYLLGHFSSPQTKTVTAGQVAMSSTTPSTTTPTPPTTTPTTTTTATTTTAPPATTTTPAPAPTTPSTTPTTTPPAAGGGAAAGAGASATVGRTVFTTNCASCHTLADAGTSGTVGPNLDQLRPNDALVTRQVTNGGGGMPAFGGQLSSTDIANVARYVSSVAGRGGGGGGGGGGGAATP